MPTTNRSARLPVWSVFVLIALPASVWGACVQEPGGVFYCYDDGTERKWDCASEYSQAMGAYVCKPCATCHVTSHVSEARSGSGYDQRRHESTHFPKGTIALAPGRSVPWKKGTLSVRDGVLTYRSRSGDEQTVYPKGARLLGDQKGRPALVTFEGAARLTRSKAPGGR